MSTIGTVPDSFSDVSIRANLHPISVALFSMTTGDDFEKLLTFIKKSGTPVG